MLEQQSKSLSCPYSSHLEVTVACAIRSGMLWPESKILELGCGDYSTPTIAAIANAQNRKFDVITSDSIWASRYEYLNGPSFTISVIDKIQWPRVTIDGQYGMVLVDNEQTVSQRIRLVKRLAQVAKTVVLHDADVIERSKRSWQPISRLFQFLYVHRQRRPYTAIMSNKVDVGFWFSISKAAQ